ncbi:hypothetical protein, partial [Amycolatopsis methanolica]|uniref:hypothetical protein n=1 Tax=Amycolatopsis methanolica TaxID=1814 RepID=UPI003436192F
PLRAASSPPGAATLPLRAASSPPGAATLPLRVACLALRVLFAAVGGWLIVVGYLGWFFAGGGGLATFVGFSAR